MLATIPIAALSLLVANVALASPVDVNVEKREAALARLSPGARAYLETLDPRDYTLDLEDFDSDLSKRSSWTDQIISNCAGTNVAVTYDDGPYIYHKNLSDLWYNAGQTVTFAVNGYNYDCAYDAPYPTYLVDSLDQGHQIISHTWSHPDLESLTDAEIDEQVDLMETFLLRVAGIIPKYIRPPYGDINNRVAKRLIQTHGYKVVIWSDDTEDADGETVAFSENIYAGIKADTPHIILNHETIHTSVTQVAPYAIKHFDSIGVKSQTLHSCLNGSGSAYKVQTTPKTRTKAWNCNNKPVPGSD